MKRSEMDMYWLWCSIVVGVAGRFCVVWSNYPWIQKPWGRIRPCTILQILQRIGNRGSLQRHGKDGCVGHGIQYASPCCPIIVFGFVPDLFPLLAWSIVLQLGISLLFGLYMSPSSTTLFGDNTAASKHCASMYSPHWTSYWHEFFVYKNDTYMQKASLMTMT